MKPSYGRNPYHNRPIEKHVIEEAIANTKSMRQAAMYASISYNTLKKYAKIYDL